MEALFLSDAHLKSKDDQSYHNMIKFLDLLGKGGETDLQSYSRKQLISIDIKPLKRISDLFIAGDFFDFWFSKNEHIYSDFKAMIEKLIELKSRGINIHLLEGNHDFFLESYFSKVLGMTVSNESTIINLDGKRALISHGDTIDKTNTNYLMMRKILRSRAFYWVQGRIPLPLLWKIAQKCSDMSKELTRDIEDKLFAEMYKFSIKKFQEGFDVIILGHCHKPALEEFLIGGRKKIFATLGDWIKYNSYLSYIDGCFELSYYRP